MVIGAGTMGAGIAQVFAQKGVDVLLNDIKQEFVDRGIAGITKQLEKKVAKGKMEEAKKAEILGHLTGIVEYDENTMKDVDLVVEAAVEIRKLNAPSSKDSIRFARKNDSRFQHVFASDYHDRYCYETC